MTIVAFACACMYVYVCLCVDLDWERGVVAYTCCVCMCVLTTLCTAHSIELPQQSQVDHLVKDDQVAKDGVHQLQDHLPS
jgi:hypothetical protein